MRVSLRKQEQKPDSDDLRVKGEMCISPIIIRLFG